jgi:hypothetical protein
MNTRLRSIEEIATSRLILTAILAACGLLALISAILFQAPGLLGKDKVLTDFDAFHLAGTMALGGRAADTYQATEMFAAQQAVSGTRAFMPWTYPPPYTLAMALLAQLPIGIAYYLFISATFVFYLVVLRRVAGDHLPGVMIAIAPTLFLIVRSGQNGFLTAALIGSCLLALMHRNVSAGLPLGLMVIKPHLAAGVALFTLFSRGWGAIAVAALVVLCALSAATLTFGMDVWAAFLGGIKEAGQFLAAAYYPLFRMTSVYAFVRSLGADPAWAMAVHATFAVFAILALLLLWRSSHCTRITAAGACCLSLFVSPYSYDYDLTIIGVAIAFVIRKIVKTATAWELGLLLVLCWLATGYGVAVSSILEFSGSGVVTSLGDNEHLSLALVPLIILIIVASRILLRQGETEVHSVTAPGSTGSPASVCRTIAQSHYSRSSPPEAGS